MFINKNPNRDVESQRKLQLRKNSILFSISRGVIFIKPNLFRILWTELGVEKWLSRRKKVWIQSEEGKQQIWVILTARHCLEILFGMLVCVYKRGICGTVKKAFTSIGSTLDRYDGLILSVCGNGRSFILILEAGPSADTSQSKIYFARMSTKVGFCRVRVPFTSFRAVNPEDHSLDPFHVHTLTIRFEPRKQRPIGLAGGKQDLRSFNLIIEYIKALPVSAILSCLCDFFCGLCTSLHTLHTVIMNILYNQR
ncbi:hypothetical protein C5167_026293 [Papaver somniferum]|nr:hypothetical protein C5167_026293 [Papaver somniferum]